MKTLRLVSYVCSRHQSCPDSLSNITTVKMSVMLFTSDFRQAVCKSVMLEGFFAAFYSLTISHMFTESLTHLLINSKWDFIFLFYSYIPQMMAFVSPLVHKTQLSGVSSLMVVLWSPVWAVDHSGILKITLGLLIACVTNIISWSLDFGGQPPLGRVVP